MLTEKTRVCRSRSLSGMAHAVSRKRQHGNPVPRARRNMACADTCVRCPTLKDAARDSGRPQHALHALAPQGVAHGNHFQQPCTSSCASATLCDMTVVSAPDGKKRWFILPPGAHSTKLLAAQQASVVHFAEKVYPRMSRRRRPIDCLQYAGEVVYLPESWVHATINIGETVRRGIETEAQR